MVWRGPHPILLLVLLATWLALARGETPFQRFQRQHVAPPKTGDENERAYCNRMMQDRDMTSPVCKPYNTFIHDGYRKRITDLCIAVWKPQGGVKRESRIEFPLINCELKTSAQSPTQGDQRKGINQTA
ncbi:ribonuclease-like, partial [Emydura macquarii macquarii]|uniref:ribonuclease-like n=1 Tax=Emydura macquarii macquarii TaxID=1129001 RepID=UPI00352B62EF